MVLNKEIITSIPSRKDLMNIINKNDGILVLKFGAEWCGPCKKIEKQVVDWFNILPANVTCGLVDADENFDVMAFFKQKRIITTIPAILRYDSDNNHWAPSDIICTSDEKEINHFFKSIVQDA